MSLHTTITRLKEVILDPNCKQMNKSTVVGFLAEVLVREKLISDGLDVEQKGNQAGHDLEVINGPKIDVKACTMKFHKKAGCNHWGWALLSESKKRKISFTHLICVAFEPSLEVRNYYVVHASNLNQFPAAEGRFKGVLNTFHIYDDTAVLPEGSDLKMIHDQCDKAVRDGWAVQVRPNESLADRLR